MECVLLLEHYLNKAWLTVCVDIMSCHQILSNPFLSHLIVSSLSPPCIALYCIASSLTLMCSLTLFALHHCFPTSMALSFISYPLIVLSFIPCARLSASSIISRSCCHVLTIPPYPYYDILMPHDRLPTVDYSLLFQVRTSQ